jgi:hypothetical protein
MTHACESCGLPLDNGPYCPYCVDDQGRLQDFDTRFERMVQWALREDPALARTQAEANTLAYMARMPAWARHPRVQGSLRDAGLAD